MTIGVNALWEFYNTTAIAPSIPAPITANTVIIVPGAALAAAPVNWTAAVGVEATLWKVFVVKVAAAQELQNGDLPAGVVVYAIP